MRHLKMSARRITLGDRVRWSVYAGHYEGRVIKEFEDDRFYTSNDLLVELDDLSHAVVTRQNVTRVGR